MSKVAVIITDMFEDSEYTEPAKAFTKAATSLYTSDWKQEAS